MLGRTAKCFCYGLIAEIEKKITEAFEVFDRESNKTVDGREIGCIIRSLGCFPNEAEVQELLAKIEEPDGFVHLENFLRVMTEVLLDRRFQPIPEDVILHAFEALDENKCGYITKEDLVKHLTEEALKLLLQNTLLLVIVPYIFTPEDFRVFPLQCVPT
ncbi:dynein regulatory complex protein 8 isoform X3 [Taeniopygia guttata]|uniref:dynein regulatory complex protein 8 isoform X3 n=1 Tax=Taeniopygia guttata TaxID=59729 RepID=UPI003BB8D9D7